MGIFRTMPTLDVPLGWLDAVQTTGTIGIRLATELRAWTDYMPKLREHLNDAPNLNFKSDNNLEADFTLQSGYSFKIHPQGINASFAFPVVLERPEGASVRALPAGAMTFSDMFAVLVRDIRGLVDAVVAVQDRGLDRIGFVARADFPHDSAPPGVLSLVEAHRGIWNGQKCPLMMTRALVLLGEREGQQDQCIHTFDFDLREGITKDTTFQLDWQRQYAPRMLLRRPDQFGRELESAAFAALSYFTEIGKGRSVAAASGPK
jgi:hypothetical protein